LDDESNISLIDFGWTAIRWQAVDFIWLECSLKFVVCCPYAKLKDLLYIEDLLDQHWGREDEIDYTDIMQRIHGKELACIVSGIATIRKNAQTRGVIKSFNEYQKGLIMMSYSLTTFPQLNRVFLFHSMANNIKKLEKLNLTGPYDTLYKNTEILWPDNAGRMVVKAAQIITIPGKALDLGCGDGKNLLYLEKLGWQVDGIDISAMAVAAATRRMNKFAWTQQGTLIIENVANFTYPDDQYDLLVNYGLYHCLSDDDLKIAHEKMLKSLKPGGYMAFATLTDRFKMPDDHGTDNEKIYLRPENFIFEFVGDQLETVDKLIGEITESHLPTIGEHKHGLTWALFRKP
jgi:SAM-dependent methyltransferase